MRYEKDGGLNYPVLPGDIWVAGAAILICGDLTRVDAAELCRRFSRPALVYCDPPWNAGIVTTFRRKAGLDDTADFPALMARVALIRAVASGRLVVDPCFGRGLTPVTARAAGHPFWGVELNPYRMSVTLQKLADTGLRPEKRGELQWQPQPRSLTAS